MAEREIAFVTGAAQGIGLATARRLAQDGFRVVAMDRAADRVGPAVAALQAEGLDVVAAVVDVCDRASVLAALNAQPRVDVMVCAAGIYNDAKLLDLTEDAFRQMLDVNVVGTRAMAMELRPSRIAVNSVAPGFTDTPMTRSAPAEMFAAWEQLEPAGKAASPAEIANAIAFFAAPSTSFVTGQTLFVDGGKSLGGLSI